MRMTWTSFVPPLTSYFSELAKVRGAGGGIWAADEIKMGELVSEASSLEDSLTPNGKLARGESVAANRKPLSVTSS